MIPLRNIYYMLAYAFRALNEQEYRDVAGENFENAAEMLSALLIRGINYQLKRGLFHSYIKREEPLSAPRGKIDITESVKRMTTRKFQLVCAYEEYSADTYLNQIIKTTMTFLLRANISPSRKKGLRKQLVYFTDIQEIDPLQIRWDFRFDNNNQSYRMLIAVCYLALNGLIQADESGAIHIMDFFDEQRECRLYEKFILEYYKKEHPELTVSSSWIAWNVDDGFSEMLPTMKTDVMLSKGKQTLIIDAKYYQRIAQINYGNVTIHSGNIYQIYTYVKNYEENQAREEHLDGEIEVSGMLLYAGTDEAVQPNYTYQMHGNKIAVRTLDLNLEFSQIAAQLDSISNEFFP